MVVFSLGKYHGNKLMKSRMEKGVKNINDSYIFACIEYLCSTIIFEVMHITGMCMTTHESIM